DLAGADVDGAGLGDEVARGADQLRAVALRITAEHGFTSVVGPSRGCRGSARGSAAEQLLQRRQLLLGRRPLRTAAAESEPRAAAGGAPGLHTLRARGVLGSALGRVAAAGLPALLLRALARPTAAESGAG